MNAHTDINFPEIAADVARALLGEPNREMSSATELRFGSRGSLSIDLTRATWYDHEEAAGGGLLELIARKTRCTNGAAVDWLREHGFAPEPEPNTDARPWIVASYPYHDEAGRLLFEVCRFHPKTFRQRAPDGRGGWTPSIKGVRRVLYRLPKLVAVPSEALVYLVEGEKDADHLAALGFTATTSPGGANKWRSEYADALRGRRVVILPDNDEAGREHAAAVLASLKAAGVQAAVLQLDGLPDKGDVTDWLAAGGQPDDLARLADAALADTTEVGEADKGSGENAEGDGIVRNSKGRPVWCSQTACAILASHPAWSGTLGYDEFNGETVVLRPIPGSKSPKSRFQPRPFAEADITLAMNWFNKNGFPRATKSVATDALFLVAGQNVISPVRDYLSALTWDGTPRLDSWLSTYLGAPPESLTSKMGRAWLISGVARALAPGVKADCALVFEGPQGAGKSSALRILASEPWFFDGLHDMHGKDASQALRGRWIIELPELSAVRRSDVEAVKAYLSRTVERYRPAYGRVEVTEPRRVIFAGSTNRTDYLNDPTGGRRFWPVRVGTIDLAALARDRDQLWAEAATMYRAGEPWWLSQQGQADAAEVVRSRAEDDPWTMNVLACVVGLEEISTTDVLERLAIPRERWSKADSMRIAGILARAGWERRGQFTSGPLKGCARYVRFPAGSP